MNIDPEAFDPISVSPTVAGATKMTRDSLPLIGWSFPPTSAQALRDGLAAAAAAAAEPPYFSPRARVLTVPNGDAEVSVRVIEPEEPATAVLVHVHGGGWVIGAAAMQDANLERIVAATGVVVASVDYGLAPENPFPGPVDECEVVTRWVLENGVQQFGTNRVLLAGESAGATLALLVALRLRETDPTAIAALSLYYGNYDLTGTPSLFADAAGAMISVAAMEWFWDQYVPELDRRDPSVSPLYADLADLPPTALAVGTEDGLRDDTLFLAARLTAAGVPVELYIANGAEHGFDSLPLPEIQETVAQMDAFLAGHAHA